MALFGVKCAEQSGDSIRGVTVVLFLWRKHEDVFSCARTKLYHVFVSQLKISALGDLFTIEHGTVCAFQVDQVWFHSADLVAKLIALLSIAELDHGMLLADAGVLCR